MGEEKGVKVTNKKINEPVLIKDTKDFYTTFAEVDLEVEDILYLAIIMFKYMPAHVEVVEPELIALTNNGWTDILSELTRRLHGYEEVARVLQFQNSEMQKKLKELLPENKDQEKRNKIYFSISLNFFKTSSNSPPLDFSSGFLGVEGWGVEDLVCPVKVGLGTGRGWAGDCPEIGCPIVLIGNLVC